MVAIPREPRPDDLPVLDFEGVTWSQRPLIPAPEHDNLCMDEYIPAPPNSGTQIILLDEEVIGDIKIAKLNYKGASEPRIVRPLTWGRFDMLGPVIRKEGDDWYLVITERQDYETPDMQLYMLEIAVEGETVVAGVTIQIVNIDDNAPIIQVFDHCVIPEMTVTGLSNCIYTVTDVDGEISTRFMTFRIDSDREADKVFYIQGQNIPNEWTRMQMTIGVTEPLNFDTNALHIFQVTALDSLPNTHTVTLMVQVENVEHRPPRWVEIFAVQQFDEKTTQQFTVRAIDGDTGIDKPIHYYLETDERDTFFSIETLPGGRTGAIFHVAPIDRDTLEREIFQLSIVAHKYDNVSFATPANVIIIVNDVNDQIPEPLHEEYHIDIMEETPMTLNFEEEFGFHDRDLGPNAQYKVHLESVYPPNAAAAFYIAPEVGYQRQTFIMGTLNHSMLDYEVPEFQHIKIKVIATDLNRTDFVGVATVYINLINWNDELPIFEQDVQTVRFDETEGKGYFVATVRAHDRDIDDRVVHTLMGNAGQYLDINEDTGDIHVSIDDAFDYHRQNQLFIQVRADDTLGEPFHTATSQLVIELNDINNTPPTLRLPRGSPEVEENVPEGYVITRDIRATDPDTTAELRFEIDWATSYATKQGRETNPIEYHGCVDIETIYPDPDHKGVANGKIVVKEIRDNVTIDFEEFEVLYLTVRVRDLQTVIGDDYDELTFTIIIIDMNDNPPVWAEGSLQQAFRVRENSASGIVIGSVLATDIDGPLYNQVRYTIFPRNNTPDDLVQIDFHTGQMSVQLDGAIDADTPPRDFLYYTVVASDRCTADEGCPPDPTYWDTEGEIAIHILDTNNKVPYALTEDFDVVVYLWENATAGTEVVQLLSNDLDRDEIYHTVSYQINYAVSPRLRNFFIVELDTGRVLVDFPTDEVLDRDGDEPTHQIFFNLIDNFYSAGGGNRNQNATEVLVILLDVNDNAPELPEPHELSWSILENLEEGKRLSPDIYAPDRDEPDTDNSRVRYDILSLTLTNRDVEPPELFVMVNIDNVTGELETAMPLRGYWGTYAIGIRACDHGIPQMCSEEVYELIIRPFNFHDPVFVFPKDGAMVRVSRERAMVNGVLVKVNGEFLDRISATDEDGLQAGIVTFQVTGDDDAAEHFTIVNDGENLGTLMLTKAFTEEIREFEVVIRGTDGGTEPNSRYSTSSLRLVYVPTQGAPRFANPTATVAFTEQKEGLTQRHELPLAEDPKNYKCDGDCHNIYYKIVDSNEGGQFAVDAATNVLYLVKELDREAAAAHTVRVVASNSPTAAPVLLDNVLTVTVNVREAFPRPIFEREVYTAGISTLDSINRELLTVHAVHSEGAPITYTLDQESMVVDPSLEAVRDSAFALHPTTGVLSLTMQPTAAMQGMFDFNVVASDATGANDSAEVKVYVISSQNRVIFKFVNTLQEVEDNRDFIASTFGAAFHMTCNIDQVVPASDAAGVAQARLTEVRAHFVLDDAPVPTEVIDELRSDLLLLRSIQDTLNSRSLLLDDLITGENPDLNQSSRITVYVLAGLSAILGFLCLVLLLTFIIRTRALKNRLEALLETKYGSQESGLNRAGLAAPGTNKHATEGSNPIWNEALKAPDFDAVSEASGDSDLIGIEDLPQFRSDYFPPEDTTSFQDIMNRKNQPVATHGNHFGFNATPFSPEFANQQFKH
ncbi:cadherin-AgCad1-like [Epargyreus clarus]|uniref:cadherin-AgCad1-like n=1 Tax=Epargyreus clarus TaxID=520877 RepID=UPI003C2EC95D